MNGNPRHQNGSSSSSRQTAAVPVGNGRGGIMGAAADDDDEEEHHRRRHDEGAPLIAPSSYENRAGGFLLGACRPSISPSPRWGTDEFLSCSPMVSGPRANLRLPNLDLREARRAAAAAANARLAGRPTASMEFDNRGGGEGGHRRNRSSSLGSRSELKKLGSRGRGDGDGPSRSSPLTLGEEMLKRRTPSGLSLMDLTGDVDLTASVDDVEFGVEMHRGGDGNHQHAGDYGATADVEETTAVYTMPLKGAEETSRPITTSQSCTIPDLNPTPPLSPKDAPPEATDDDLLLELKREFESQSNPPLLSLMYGLVNTSIVLPVIMSFGSIIYHDDFFRPYLSVLMKMTLVSGAVHQTCFSTISSLPFAVGQVQDAGEHAAALHV